MEQSRGKRSSMAPGAESIDAPSSARLGRACLGLAPRVPACRLGAAAPPPPPPQSNLQALSVAGSRCLRPFGPLGTKQPAPGRQAARCLFRASGLDLGTVPSELRVPQVLYLQGGRSPVSSRAGRKLLPLSLPPAPSSSIHHRPMPTARSHRKQAVLPPAIAPSIGQVPRSQP